MKMKQTTTTPIIIKRTRARSRSIQKNESTSSPSPTRRPYNKKLISPNKQIKITKKISKKLKPSSPSSPIRSKSITRKGVAVPYKETRSRSRSFSQSSSSSLKAQTTTTSATTTHKLMLKKKTKSLIKKTGKRESQREQSPYSSQSQSSTTYSQQDDLKKLNLVLDLDETLVNSLWRTSENALEFEKLKKSAPSNVYYFSYKTAYSVNNTNNNVSNSSNEGVNNTNGKKKSKKNEVLSAIRPHLREFLQQVSKYYKVYLYSHGRAEYVQCLLEKINPKRDIFDISSRVFKNEGQVTSGSKKELKNLFASHKNSEAMLAKTIIVDDYFDVWEAGASNNIVLVKRYQPINKKSHSEKVYSVAWNSYYPNESISLPAEQQSTFEDTESDPSQNKNLLFLADHLISVAKAHLFKPKSDIRSELQAKSSSILKGIQINLELLKGSRKGDKLLEVLTCIVERLGATCSTQTNQRDVVIIDCKRGRTQLSESELASNTVVDSKWLIDCFFANKKLDKTPYLTSSNDE